MTYLKQQGISLQEKKVLDVGFGFGFNADAMRENGADVWGVELRKEAYEFAISNNYIDKDKAFPCLLQDLPEQLQGIFDIVTVFLYNIPFKEKESFIQALTQVIKPDGTIIIGIYNDIYIYGANYGDILLESIPSSIQRVFNNMS